MQRYWIRFRPTARGCGLPIAPEEFTSKCGLDHLLTGEKEYMKREGIVLLSYPFFRFQAREPIDEAVGKLFRYRCEDHAVGAR